MARADAAWGGTSPFPGTMIVLTHRTEDQPDPSTGFLLAAGCGGNDASTDGDNPTVTVSGVNVPALVGEGMVVDGLGPDRLSRSSRTDQAASAVAWSNGRDWEGRVGRRRVDAAAVRV